MWKIQKTKKDKKDIFFMLWLGMFTACIASAEPVVIRDYGGRDSGVPGKQELIRLAQQQKATKQMFDENLRYPIQSGLRPGYLNVPKKLREPVKGAQPFFVVGNDDFSRDWITKNKMYLLKIGAQGLVTNIDSKRLFLELKAFADPLPLVAVPVDEIAEILQFSVYPVLVTGEEIAQ